MHTYNFALLLFSQTPISFSWFQTRLSSSEHYCYESVPFTFIIDSLFIISKGQHPVLILLDLSVTFDIVDHFSSFFFFFLIISFPGYHILVFLWSFILCLLCHLFLSTSPFELWLPWDLIRSRLLYLHSFP